jgi:hypothetical protein
MSHDVLAFLSLVTLLFLSRQHTTHDLRLPPFVFLPGLINLSNLFYSVLFHFHPSVSLLFYFLKHPSLYFRPNRG